MSTFHLIVRPRSPHLFENWDTPLSVIPREAAIEDIELPSVSIWVSTGSGLPNVQVIGLRTSKALSKTIMVRSPSALGYRVSEEHNNIPYMSSHFATRAQSQDKSNYEIGIPYNIPTVSLPLAVVLHDDELRSSHSPPHREQKSMCMGR